MVITKKTLFICLLSILGIHGILAQTADVLGGCVPHKVNFTSPDLSEYFWDFDDSASSNLQNPEHVFIEAGLYTVILYEGINNDSIGSIEIIVYDDPIIEIDFTENEVCGGLEFEFTSTITMHPDLNVVSYLWSFGDGGTSTEENPTYVFSGVGEYSVSLAVTTNLTECDITQIFENYLIVSEEQVTLVEPIFELDKFTSCTVPTTFNISNLTEININYQYIWDLGNGDEFNGYNIDNYTYDEEGSYTISLKVIDENGCETSIDQTVVIGEPSFDFVLRDTCINSIFQVENNSVGFLYLWSFGSNAVPSTSNEKSPEVKFNTSGPQNITLTIVTDLECTIDTTFTIIIEDPSALFTIDPPTSNCTEPTDLNIDALVQGYADYTWNIWDENEPNFNISHKWPKRDSLHIHGIDSLKVSLTVTTEIGCKANHEDFFTQRKPDAVFKINKSRGCAPLDVTFRDTSQSIENIVSWKYLFGNGDEVVFTDGADQSYTYEETGDYYARLIIENEAGCIDTSAGLWIYVGEQIPSNYTLDKSVICLGDSINIEMTNVDERIDAWHFTSDDFRFQHCWKSNTATHYFTNKPGIFDITLETEYNGCHWSETISDKIQVNGSKANISWMTNCEDPYTVMFDSKSIGETSLEWTLIGSSTYTDPSFSHTFDSKGIKTLYLETTDNTSNCPNSLDSAVVHIVDIVADFQLPEFVCDNVLYTLFAENSIDVNESCHKGYLWNLPNRRPRELGDDRIKVSFPDKGYQEVSLIVENINGCTDTLTRGTTSYGMDPDFEFDVEKICLPNEVNFNDLSIADTSIISWKWNFVSQEQNPSHEFTQTNTEDGVRVILYLEDAVGCKDTIRQVIPVYEVTSDIGIDNGPIICQGEGINFTASDFTLEGSFLNYEWNFQEFGTGTEQNEYVLFDESGLVNVELTFTEDKSGCSGSVNLPINVLPQPKADFNTPVDSLEEICHPAIIEFNNTTQGNGNFTYLWDFGGQGTSIQEDPVNSFPKGTYTVEMFATSEEGCRDTISKTYKLVGPEGEMQIDKNTICVGETIILSMSDTVDVNSFTWGFGDGTTMNNIAPIEHVYDFFPPNGETKVDLILKSAENGCEFIISETIFFEEMNADFTFNDSSICNSRAVFFNTSTENLTNFKWDFGNGESSVDPNPIQIFTDPGIYTVTLIASSDDGECIDERTQEIEMGPLPEFLYFPNVFTPNNDGENDRFNVAVLPEYAHVVKVVTFKVFNRWGNLIYDNDEPDFGWDGMKDNAPAPAEVYAYFIELELIDCENKTKKGNVTILR